MLKENFTTSRILTFIISGWRWGINHWKIRNYLSETVEDKIREEPICNSASVNQPAVMNSHLLSPHRSLSTGVSIVNLINKVNEQIVKKMHLTATTGKKRILTPE